MLRILPFKYPQLSLPVTIRAPQLKLYIMKSTQRNQAKNPLITFEHLRVKPGERARPSNSLSLLEHSNRCIGRWNRQNCFYTYSRCANHSSSVGSFAVDFVALRSTTLSVHAAFILRPSLLSPLFGSLSVEELTFSLLLGWTLLLV